MSTDDLKSKLNAKAEEAEKQQKSHDEFMRFKAKEYPRLVHEAYGRIKAHLDGIKGLTVSPRPLNQRGAKGDYDLPSLVIKSTFGPTVEFRPINNPNAGIIGFNGKIEIHVNSNELDESINMIGEDEGPWELVAFSRTNRQPRIERLTDEVLSALLERLIQS